MTVRLKGNIYLTDFMYKGTRYRVTTGTGDKREAERFERELIKDVRAGLIPQTHTASQHDSRASVVTSKAHAGMTLRQGFDRMLKAVWSHGRNYDNCEHNADEVCSILGADTLLSNVQEPQIDKFVQALHDKKNSDGTINRKLSTLQTMLNTACEQWKEIERVPSFKGFKKKEPPKRFFVFTPELQDQFVTLCRESGRLHGQTVADLIIVLADTGARLGEILALKYSDVNLLEGLIHIWENKADYPRSIPMTKRVKAILESRKEQGEKPFGGLVYQSVRDMFNYCKKKLGLPENDGQIVPHALRHTTASRLVRKGESLFVVQQFLGHKSSTTTQRYAHLAPETLRKAASKLED